MLKARNCKICDKNRIEIECICYNDMLIMWFEKSYYISKVDLWYYLNQNMYKILNREDLGTIGTVVMVYINLLEEWTVRVKHN